MVLGRALGLGQAFEAIAGDDDAGAAVEAKAGAVIEPGNLFQARVSARRRGGGQHDGSPVDGRQAVGAVSAASAGSMAKPSALASAMAASMSAVVMLKAAAKSPSVSCALG
jgi:hypothetical protein